VAPRSKAERFGWTKRNQKQKEWSFSWKGTGGQHPLLDVLADVQPVVELEQVGRQPAEQAVRAGLVGRAVAGWQTGGVREVSGPAFIARCDSSLRAGPSPRRVVSHFASL
jgi:hypothetical protein